jgi:hypothetical protein
MRYLIKKNMTLETYLKRLTTDEDEMSIKRRSNRRRRRVRIAAGRARVASFLEEVLVVVVVLVVARCKVVKHVQQVGEQTSPGLLKKTNI